MANDVFANGREISCKKADGKTICEFPDVCFTPPENPATPPGVPVPYPNTAFAKDTTEGSKSVKISGQEVMLKNVSYFKTSTGDEAGSAAKKGIITSTNKGKAYFISWSMDVKYEGKNVVRNLDMTTNNHASPAADGSVPQVETDSQAIPDKVDCAKVLKKHPVLSHKDQQARCKVIKADTGVEYQSHHVIQNSHLQYPRGTTLKEICPGYSEDAAPCIALQDGVDTSTPHGRVSQMQKADGKRHRANYRENNKSPTYQDARSDAKNQLTAKKPGPSLSEGEANCILAEVDRQFEEMCKKGMKDQSKFNLRPPGQRGKGLPKLPGSGGGAGGGL